MNPMDFLSAMIFGGDGGSSNVEDLSTSGGASDSGKVLAVNSNGNIEPVNLSVGQGTVAVDKTFKVTGAAADSKAVGDAIDSLNGSLGSLSDLETESKTDLVSAINEAAQRGLSDDAKATLLACFQHVAWIDSHGQDYYNALQNALYDVAIVSISAIFDSGGQTIYTDDDLSSLRQYLTVKALYETGVSVVVTSYTLSGTLIGGESTITVSYNGKSTTIKVNAIDFYDKFEWVYSNGDIVKLNGTLGITNGILKSGTGSPYINSMRLFCVTKGKATEIQDTSPAVYLIPVPKTANNVSVSVVASTIYIRCSVYRYDQTTGKYELVFGTAWAQGSTSRAFTAENNLYLAILLKATSDGETAFVNEPTEVTAIFTED